MGFYLLLFFLWGEQRKKQKGRQEAVGGRGGRREEEKEEVWVDGRRKEGSGSREAGGAGGGLGGVAHISTKAGVLSGKVRGSDANKDHFGRDLGKQSRKYQQKQKTGETKVKHIKQRLNTLHFLYFYVRSCTMCARDR